MTFMPVIEKYSFFTLYHRKLGEADTFNHKAFNYHDNLTMAYSQQQKSS